MTLEASLGNQSCISRKDLANKLARWGTIDGVLAQTGTGFSSQIGTKLRDWAVGQALGSCYSWAALSSKTLYYTKSCCSHFRCLVAKAGDSILKQVL